MTAAFIRKPALILLAYFGLISGSFGQLYTLEMNVPYESQKTGSWCWTACMRMIMQFHDPNNTSAHPTQCELAKRLLKLEFPTSAQAINNIDCCIDCTGGCPSDITPDPCTAGTLVSILRDKTVRYTYDGQTLPAVPDAYDLIFSLQDYTSTQLMSRIGIPPTWEQVKKEIRDCRPFIININPSPDPGSDLSADHALVMTGFQEDTINDIQFLIGNDPWVPCCTTENRVLFPYNIFQRMDASSATTEEGGTYLVNRVLSSVVDIQINTRFRNPPIEDCESCDLLTVEHSGNSFWQESTSTPTETSLLDEQPTPLLVSNENPFKERAGWLNNSEPNEPDKFINMLIRGGDRIAGYRKPTLKEREYQDLVGQQDYLHAEVEYISSIRLNKTSFLSCLFPPKKLSKVKATGYEVVDIVSSGVDKNLVSTFQKVGSEWDLRKIATYTYLNEDILIRREDTLSRNPPFILSNSPDTARSRNRTGFRLVKYPPFQYEFYSFSDGRQNYLAPADNYPDLDLNGRTAYREKTVVKSLRKQTIDFEKVIRDLFASRREYKDYVVDQLLAVSRNN